MVYAVCMLVYGLVLYGGETLEAFFLWDKLDRGKQLDFVVSV
jgi:hypothetical protein